MNKVLWLDLETTGLSPQKNGVIQLAYMYEENGKMITKDNIKSQVFKKDVIEKGASEVNGLTIKDIKQFMKVKEAFNNFLFFLEKKVNKEDPKDKIMLAGFNTGFDKDFLMSWFRKNKNKDFNKYFNHKVYDVMQMSISLNYHNIIQTKNNKLVTLCEYFEIPLNAHDAMSDIYATYELDKKMVKKLKMGK